VTKETLRKLRDDERQTDVGRQIITKMLRGQDRPAPRAPFFTPPQAADDDPRPDDAE